jgi:hypothetical protein
VTPPCRRFVSVTLRAPARQKILTQPELAQLSPAPGVPEDERGEGKARTALRAPRRTEPVGHSIFRTVHGRCYYACPSALEAVRNLAAHTILA